jgi:ABC-type glycerol-3-phosphate transport system permease component
MAIGKNPSRFLWHLTALIGVVITLGPFVWMLSSSLKLSGALFAYPPVLIPKEWAWSNYAETFEQIPFLRYILNTVYIAGLSAIGQAFCCSTAGFAFARLEFWGRRVIFWSLMAAVMIPPQVTIVPLFLMVNSIGLLDTYYPIILPFFNSTRPCPWIWTMQRG